MTTSASQEAAEKDEEGLIVLSEYLDLSLVKGGNLVMMEQCAEVCGMYLGDASGGQAVLKFQGTITGQEAIEILRLTRAGRNQVDIAGRDYRFLRTVTDFEDRSAILFQPL